MIMIMILMILIIITTTSTTATTTITTTTTTIIIIIITTTTIIALKGAVRDLYNLLCAPLPVSNTYAQVARAQSCITCNTSSAYHVEHVVCHVVGRDSSAIRFDRIEIAFILALSYFLKPLTDEGGEETRVPGENP